MAAVTGSNYKWRLVGFLFCVAALNYGDRTAISSVFPLLRSEFGATDVELGAIGTVFLWAYAIASPIAGNLADRMSRSRTIVLTLAAWSVITLLTGFATSVTQILVSRALLGFAEAAYLPAAIALIADYHDSKTRASAISLHTAGLTFGLVAGGAGSGYLAEAFGWRVGFFILGVLGLGLAAAANFYLRDQTAPSERETAPAPIFQSVMKIVSVPSCMIVFTESMFVAIGTWIFLNWLPLYFRETYSMGLGAAGFAGTFMLQGGATIGLLAGGYLSDAVAGERPRKRMLVQTIAYLVSAPFLIAFLAHPALALLYPCIFAFAFFAKVGGTNETPLLCDLLPVRLRSTSIGLMNSVNCFAGGLGIMVAGFLKAEWGLGGVFSGISALMLLAAVLTTIGYKVFLARDLARPVAAEEAIMAEEWVKKS